MLQIHPLGAALLCMVAIWLLYLAGGRPCLRHQWSPWNSRSWMFTLHFMRKCGRCGKRQFRTELPK